MFIVDSGNSLALTGDKLSSEPMLTKIPSPYMVLLDHNKLTHRCLAEMIVSLRYTFETHFRIDTKRISIEHAPREPFN